MQRKTRRTRLVAIALVLAVLGLAAWSASAQDETAAPDDTYNLLSNAHLELYAPPYGQWHPWGICWINKKVASSWVRFSLDPAEPAFLRAQDFADSCMGSGWVECLAGGVQHCQFIVSTDPYDAGIYQRVTGLTPGVGYGFHGVLMTLWGPPGDPQDRMLKQIGLDLTGGTDPAAPTVTWTELNGQDRVIDLQQRVSALAEGPAATVFFHVISLDPCQYAAVNLSILDSAILAQTPTVSASSPATSSADSFWVSWDNFVPAPGLKYFRGCDVQWMDEAEGTWHDWLSQTMDEGATFDGEYGHTYRFRARAWQQYQNNAWLYGPYSATYDSRTEVYWARLGGHVASADGRPVWGAEVRVLETGQKAWTAPDGLYRMDLLPGHDQLSLSVSSPGWLAPGEVYGVEVAQGQTASVDWVLRPPDDAVANGGFEEGLSGWQVVSDQGVIPAVVAEPVHTGLGALELGGEAAPAHTVAVSQTVSFDGAWEPALSFLYWPGEVDEGDVFTVELCLEQEITPGQALTTTWTVTPTLEAGGWTHFWTAVGPGERAVSGTLGIEMRVHDDGGGATVVYVDEVSAGATPGGPYRVYLPVAFKLSGEP